MKKSQYLKDQLLVGALHVFAMLALTSFLLSLNIQFEEVLLIILVWLTGTVLYSFLDYRSKNKRISRMCALLEELEHKYLLSEVMDVPDTGEGLAYFKVLKACNKSMLEKVSATKRERKEYKDYIEQWIHEVKTPIAAIQIMCANNRSELSSKVLSELQKIDLYAEQALYYARSDEAERDFLVKEVSVTDLVHQAIADNKQILLRNDVRVYVEYSAHTVYTDRKWVEFILKQLIINAVKYRNEHSPEIRFQVNPISIGLALTVKDNGIGISESDLPRIFDKGFTGENGRMRKKSTGMGLYICKRLGDKLGIHLEAAARPDEGTSITLKFPKGTFIKV
ncbi:sensor histidine kinase [Paenibacillus sp. CN-4]|uniref:sensor histidine kinase n=1 Tax=Paenibacillus nanchangensis TaxID=3348343 RepID=UPI00397CE258